MNKRKMKQKIILFLNITGIVGLLMIIAGGIMLKAVPDGDEGLFCAVILSGLALLVISALAVNFMTVSVYVCPECKAQLDIPRDEFTLTTGNSRHTWASLLTCPECKKTNLCRKKRVLKSDNE